MREEISLRNKVRTVKVRNRKAGMKWVELKRAKRSQREDKGNCQPVPQTAKVSATKTHQRVIKCIFLDAVTAPKNSKRKKTSEESSKSSTSSTTTTVGRQTNNSLAAATGQIVIQPVANSHKKKLKTSQV
jgi:hypothetical protein